jgi:hypothetical protein
VVVEKKHNPPEAGCGMLVIESHSIAAESGDHHFFATYIEQNQRKRR